MKTEHAENVGPLDEAALVEAARHDRAAFGPLYERYVDSIYRYVYRRVGNHATAEAVTARTFERALATLADFEQDDTSFGAWLFAIARDLITGTERNAAHEPPLDDDTTDDQLGSDVTGSEWLALRNGEAAELLTALYRLPLDQQRAIVFKFAHGLTSQEIAAALGRSEDDAKQLVHRALIALRAALESK